MESIAGGFLSGKYTREQSVAGSRRENFDFPPIDKEKGYDLVEVLSSIATAHNITVAQVALAWVRQQSGITSTIIGAKTVAQLNDNLRSIEIQLSSEDLAKINDVSPLAMQYPGWMVNRQSAYRS